MTVPQTTDTQQTKFESALSAIFDETSAGPCWLDRRSCGYHPRDVRADRGHRAQTPRIAPRRYPARQACIRQSTSSEDNGGSGGGGGWVTAQRQQDSEQRTAGLPAAIPRSTSSQCEGRGKRNAQSAATVRTARKVIPGMVNSTNRRRRISSRIA